MSKRKLINLFTTLAYVGLVKRLLSNSPNLSWLPGRDDMVEYITTDEAELCATGTARLSPIVVSIPDRVRRPRQRWLVTILLIDLVALVADRLLLSPEGLLVAAELRLGLVTPLLLLAIALNQTSNNQVLLDLTNASGSFAFFVAATTIGLWADEPSASRYMVAALFIMFSATIFATLPMRTRAISA